MTKVSQQLTNLDAVELIAQSLLEKASTPRPLSLPELLRKVKPSITKMLKNGHIYSDVVEVLASYEVMTTVSVVEAIHTEVKKIKGGKGKGKGKDKDLSAEAEVLIEASTAEAILKAFESQASIRKGLTKEELVVRLRESIEKMLAAHYTYEDISKVMESCGVQISPATIKSYYQGQKRLHHLEDAEIESEVTDAKESLAVASKNFKPLSKKKINSESGSLTDTKSDEVKTPSFKESRLIAPESKRLRESSLDEEEDLEKEFNL
jgi:hypothetical protein